MQSKNFGTYTTRISLRHIWECMCQPAHLQQDIELRSYLFGLLAYRDSSVTKMLNDIWLGVCNALDNQRTGLEQFGQSTMEGDVMQKIQRLKAFLRMPHGSSPSHRAVDMINRLSPLALAAEATLSLPLIYMDNNNQIMYDGRYMAAATWQPTSVVRLSLT